nr:hypothetical protein [Dehalococcoidia bacterium]
MKRFLILIVLVLAGCGESDQEAVQNSSQGLTPEVIEKVNATLTITDEQAKILSKVEGVLDLNGLTSITDTQAENLSKVRSIRLNGLTS